MKLCLIYIWCTLFRKTTSKYPETNSQNTTKQNKEKMNFSLGCCHKLWQIQLHNKANLQKTLGNIKSRNCSLKNFGLCSNSLSTIIIPNTLSSSWTDYTFGYLGSISILRIPTWLIPTLKAFPNTFEFEPV